MQKYQGAMGVSRIGEVFGFQCDTYEGLIKEVDEWALAYLGGLEKDLYDLGVVQITKRAFRHRSLGSWQRRRWRGAPLRKSGVRHQVGGKIFAQE